MFTSKLLPAEERIRFTEEQKIHRDSVMKTAAAAAGALRWHRGFHGSSTKSCRKRSSQRLEKRKSVGTNGDLMVI